MRRHLLLAVSALATLGLPAASLGQAPNQDSVVGSGSTDFASSFDFNVTGGPSGENPTGSITVKIGALTSTFADEIVCLSVNGNTATLVDRSGPTPLSFDFDKFTLTDNGPAGSGLDRANGNGFSGSTPPDCSPLLPSEGATGREQTVLTGDIVVVDAKPRPPVPTRDSIVGSGSAPDFPTLDFNVSSGPSGEDPSGSSTVVYAGTTLSSASISCLTVRGNTATYAGPLAPPNSGFAFGKATVVDNGPTGDRYNAVGSSAPLNCSTPAGAAFGGTLLSGNITVVDAKPAHTGPKVSMKLRPRGGCVSSAVTVTAKATGAKLSRLVLLLDGRQLVRTKRRRLELRVNTRVLEPGIHRLKAVALGKGGGRAAKTRAFRRCAAPAFTG